MYFNDDLDLTVEEIWNNGKLINTVSVEPKYAIAYAITKAREEMGLSQSELSKLTGVTQCDISRIEGAVANPTLETITKLCKSLGLDVSLSFENSSVQLQYRVLDEKGVISMAFDSKKKLITHCGLDCEKCEARLATINNNGSL